jgi:hypothetical protein
MGAMLVLGARAEKTKVLMTWLIMDFIYICLMVIKKLAQSFEQRHIFFSLSLQILAASFLWLAMFNVMSAQQGAVWLDKVMAGASEKIEVKAGLGAAVVISTVSVGMKMEQRTIKFI